MNLKEMIHQLDINAKRIQWLVQDVSPDQGHYKPSQDDWSMVEVINHLYDEEREDFRQRVDTILHKPGDSLPPINPEAWVIEREYNLRALEPSLENFLEERGRSVRWLATLEAPNWDLTFTKDDFSIRAGDVMVSWVAHDQLHMRQLIELQRALTVRDSTPYQVDYAGQW